MNKRAIALVIGLILTAVLTTLGAAMISRSLSEYNLARKQVENTQAFWLAEAGVNKALKILRDDYNSLSIRNVSFGAGGYAVAIVNNLDGSRTVTSSGFIPTSGITRVIEANMVRFSTTPPDFFGNAIYSADNVDLNGSFDVIGKIRYAAALARNGSGTVSDTITRDPSINPLARLSFAQLRALSQSQGNYHDAAHLSGPFPTGFWFNQASGIPNVVFLEGNLTLSGKVTAGGFFVVGGEVTYNATISGNVSVDGAIYTLGQFTINGGGNALNVNGGVWTGQLATLNGNSKISYNSTYMSAIQSLGINTDVQIISWTDLQNPYNL